MRSLFVLLVTLMFSLGCMGAVNSLTGLDLQIELGESAVHPADFPAKEPAVGTKAMSLAMTAPGDNLDIPEDVEVDLSDQDYRMEVIAYELEGVDGSSLLPTAQQQVLDAGYTLLDEQDGIYTYQDGDVLFIVVDPAVDEEETFTLMRITPVPADAPSPE